MSRSFYVYKINNGKFKAEFLNPETGMRVCVRTIEAKSDHEAAEIAAGWVHNGIPKRQRGRTQVYKRSAVQSKEAVIGLAAILKAIKSSPDLDQAGAMEIARTLKTMGLLKLGVSLSVQGDLDFIKFLRGFWDYDKSLYLKDRRAHGKDITLRTCADNLATNKNPRGRAAGYLRFFFESQSNKPGCLSSSPALYNCLYSFPCDLT